MQTLVARAFGPRGHRQVAFVDRSVGPFDARQLALLGVARTRGWDVPRDMSVEPRAACLPTELVLRRTCGPPLRDEPLEASAQHFSIIF